MKKVLYTVFFLASMAITYSVQAAVVCNQTFEGTYLRYDKTYRFYDTLTNGTNKNVYVNTRQIRFVDDMGAREVMTSRFLDPGSAFDWTQTLRNSNFTVSPGQTMRIIETGATKWRVDQKPSVRTTAKRNNHDFMIYYKVWYDFSNNYPNASDDIQHVECQYFSVTWCGDGVRDAGYEVCDPNDPSRTGWGNGGCNKNTCEPINVDPPATCDSLTATPASGKAPLDVSVRCSGTKATSYQIACGNGQVINGATWVCKYATNSNYEARCTVNGNITSNACKQTIRVTAPNPAIRIDKLDANSADIDNIVGNDTQTVATWQKAVFKIRVTNTWEEPLKNLKVIDAIAPNCAGSVTLPNTKPATWSNFVVAWSGNHTNNTLDVGEYFEYTCEKSNTTEPYDNRANTEGTGVTSGEKVTDTDDTKVRLVTPSIKVVKMDANPADQDGNTGNDTQTVNVGEKAVFKIRVTNDGTEDLKSIVLTDSVAPNCGGAITLPSSIPATWSNFVVAWSGNHNDGFLQPWEYFEYTCERLNTTTGYTNEVLVDAQWRYSNKRVTDDDPSLVKITDVVPACISLNVAPLTGNAPLTSNVVCTGEKVETFKIDCGNWQIFNKDGTNGGEESFNATCSYSNVGTYTPRCFINDTISSNACQKTVTVSENLFYDLALRKTLSSTTPGPFNIGENVTFNIEVFNQGTINANNIEITDYIPTGLTLNDTNWTQTGSLAISTISSIAAGQSVNLPISFTINSAATGVITNLAEITRDDGDDCDSTPDSNPTNDGTPVNDDIGNGCNPGGDEDDHDLEPIVIGGTVGPAISIDKVDANTADIDGNVGNDTQTVNVGDKAVFKIRVTNTGTEALKNIVLTDAIAPNCAGSVTLPGTYPSTFLSFITAGSGDHTNGLLDIGEYFEYTCEKSSTASPYTNSATVNAVGDTSGTGVTDTDTSVVIIPGSSSSSGSSGGGPNECFSIEQTGNTITCVGDSQTRNFKLDCGNGEEIISGSALDLTNSSRVYWDFNVADCKYDTIPKTTIAQCYVATRISGSPSWRTRFQCQLTDNAPICWDGIIQPERGEQCEKAINQVCSNGSTPTKNTDGDYICSNGVKATPVIGSFPALCTSSCKITGSSSGGWSSSSSGGWVITIPNQGEINFWPVGNMVIGHGTNPLVEIGGGKPYIKNNSDYDLAFDEICVTKKGVALDGQQTQCQSLGDILYPGEVVTFDNYPVYTGNRNNIPANQSYANNELITTIRTTNSSGIKELYDWAYFAAKLGVRVSKPAVATTGGGTSLVKDTTKMANISEVADGIEDTDNNKNFVGVGVSTGNTSSFSDTVTDTAAVDTVSSQGDIYNQSIDKVSKTDVLTEALTGVSGLGEFENYNGLENVYILKGKNVTLTNIPAALSGARTYIIEGGNLTIAGNLAYSDNIAFVVRWGNIIVEDAVTNMSGTYISIPVSGTGGSIMAEESDKQLVVSGSLYGNISNLVNNRYYVDNNSTTWVINVGTIVKFGSSLFKKPAPLVGQFISEYLATEKVSQ